MAVPKLGHYPPPDFPIVVRGLAGLSRLLAVMEGIGIGICLVGLIGLAVFQFVSRNLRMNHQMWMVAAPDWADGVIRHSVFLLGFLGAAYATFTTRHIRIDAVTRMVAPRRRIVLRILSTIGALVLLGFLLQAARRFYGICLQEVGEAAMEGQIFTSARGALIMLAGFGLVAFHFFVQLVLDIAWLASGKEPPPHWIAEASHGGDVAAPAPGGQGMA